MWHKITSRDKRLRYKYCRKAKKLEAALDARIEIERYGKSGDRCVRYWVWPTNLYYDRPDPYAGRHMCSNWEEIYERLVVYQMDMVFHYLGINHFQTNRITDRLPDEMLEKWREEGFLDDHRKVMSDWLEENGFTDESVWLREASGNIPVSVRTGNPEKVK